MGCIKNIKHDEFPEQGKYLGRLVEVCFHYDTDNSISGEIVRDDSEEPFKMIIKLDNDRYVESSECQYSLKKRFEGLKDVIKND